MATSLIYITDHRLHTTNQTAVLQTSVPKIISMQAILCSNTPRVSFHFITDFKLFFQLFYKGSLRNFKLKYGPCFSSYAQTIYSPLLIHSPNQCLSLTIIMNHPQGNSVKNCINDAFAKWKEWFKLNKLSIHSGKVNLAKYVTNNTNVLIW